MFLLIFIEPSEDENEDTSLFYVSISIGVAVFIMAASSIGFLHAKSIPSSQEVDEPLLPRYGFFLLVMILNLFLKILTSRSPPNFTSKMS